MTPKRVFFMMVGTVSLAVVLIGGAIYAGNKLLSQESRKLVDLKATNEVLGQEEVNLAQAKKEVVKYKYIDDITQTIVPQDKDQARAVREVVSLAAESGISLQSITFPASNLGQKAPSQPSGDNTNSSQNAPKVSISQAKPVDGIKGVYSLEATIVPTDNVSYYQFIDFLSRLEKNRRTAQVTHIKIEPKSADSRNPLITFSLTINIFLKP